MNEFNTMRLKWNKNDAHQIKYSLCNWAKQNTEEYERLFVQSSWNLIMKFVVVSTVCCCLYCKHFLCMKITVIWKIRNLSLNPTAAKKKIIEEEWINKMKMKWGPIDRVKEKEWTKKAFTNTLIHFSKMFYQMVCTL